MSSTSVIAKRRLGIVLVLKISAFLTNAAFVRPRTSRFPRAATLKDSLRDLVDIISVRIARKSLKEPLINFGWVSISSDKASREAFPLS